MLPCASATRLAPPRPSGLQATTAAPAFVSSVVDYVACIAMLHLRKVTAQTLVSCEANLVPP